LDRLGPCLRNYGFKTEFVNAFLRQLTIYQFTKHSRTEFMHPYFLRHDKDAMIRIKSSIPSKSESAKECAAPSSSAAPVASAPEYWNSANGMASVEMAIECLRRELYDIRSENTDLRKRVRVLEEASEGPCVSKAVVGVDAEADDEDFLERAYYSSFA